MQIKTITVAALTAMCAIGANATTGPTASAGALTTGSSAITLVQGNNESGGYVGSAGSVSGVRTEPTGAIGNWLAATPFPDSTPTPEGAATEGPATVSFVSGTKAVSFEWGTPSSFDTLVVDEVSASGTVTPTSFSYSAFSDLSNFGSDGYVTITADANSTIKSLTFESNQNAFEAANFRAVAVPEPANVALLVAGLGMLGFMARKRSL